ncbi:phosphohistidine phosphatase [Sphaerisporangium siamense]|uniref:Phosphohistidine phosphatase n=1 Tax=Sphaerisporangium siamense TaxID=795645 RepID=A0A7W7G9J4_9ACTN|nr:histidine phosphatase family protein [Sphaerisporangium siamense]MBB4699056.1 phosphohistidine phosphatase [Sphaerisporangium siamense]GII86818.1 phosphohistidine phosphatase [Sphaerisporangium siamense]
MNTLIVLRHAKAAQVPGLADRERPLTGRGERDAGRAGRALRSLGLSPDLVLCSPSLRTRQTAELALADLAPSAPLHLESEIYEAYPDELLELVGRTDEDVSTLLLVGHNPGVHELVMNLSLSHDDEGFPPGAFAVLETDGWAGLGPGDGRVVHRWKPRDD